MRRFGAIFLIAGASLAQIDAPNNSKGGLRGRTVESKLADTVSVLDFEGADPSGAADSGPAFSAAFKAVAPGDGKNRYGGTLKVPCGTFKISNPVVFTTVNSFRMEGAGGCTKFISGLISPPIIAASWAAGTASYATGAAHGLKTGDRVSIMGIVGSRSAYQIGYNVPVCVATVRDSTHFTCPVIEDPATYTSGGLAVTKTMFLLQDCYKCEFSGFYVGVGSANPVLNVFQQINSGSGPRFSSISNRFVNIEIQCSGGNCATGAYQGGGVDGNNDQTFFESVVVENYGHSAFTLDNSQVYDDVFLHSSFAGDGFGQIGVEAIKGSYHWYLGDGGGNTIADFTDNPFGGSTSEIVGSYFENSTAFLVTDGPAYNLRQTSIRNVGWAGNCLGDGPANIRANKCVHPGGFAITYKMAGPLAIENSNFGEVGPSLDLKIFIQSFGSAVPNVASVTNTVFGGANKTTETLFPISAPTAMSGSSAYNSVTGVFTPLAVPGTASPLTGLTRCTPVTNTVSGICTNSGCTTTTSLTYVSGLNCQ